MKSHAGNTTSYHKARNMALIILSSMVLGNLILELGNIATYGMQTQDHHLFNNFLGMVGFLGLFIYGIALVRRRGVHITVVRRRKNDTKH